jgi:hypothetical protein
VEAKTRKWVVKARTIIKRIVNPTYRVTEQKRSIFSEVTVSVIVRGKKS